jgi:hypothetical protein
MKQQSYFTSAKSLKVEVYDSKHLVDLMDCHEQVLKLIEESEKRLESLIQNKEKVVGPLKQRLVEVEKATS